MKKALLYEKEGKDTVKCRLCMHHCTIKLGKRGICQVRENQGGELVFLPAKNVTMTIVWPD
jgi:pyruvate formate lyase activating enzyme